ncbi:unnamed protein product [Caenorhabditis nigoni]
MNGTSGKFRPIFLKKTTSSIILIPWDFVIIGFLFQNDEPQSSWFEGGGRRLGRRNSNRWVVEYFGFSNPIGTEKIDNLIAFHVGDYVPCPTRRIGCQLR